MSQSRLLFKTIVGIFNRKALGGKVVKCHADESRTFFSQWGPPALLFGAFAAFVIGTFLITAFSPNRGSGPQYGMLIVLPFFFFLWLMFFWRVRFEDDRACIFCFGFFPSRLDYADVEDVKYFFHDCKYPDTPTSLLFRLKSGEMKRWSISCFVPAARQGIVRELNERIRLTETPQEIPDIQTWADDAVSISRGAKIFFCFAAIALFLLGFWEMCRQLTWNDRVRKWDRADGVILKNAENVQTDVTEIEYEYTYRGKMYLGTRIVYDSKVFPNLASGTHCKVMVNPEKPQDCAIMFRYRRHWGWVRYCECAFFYAVSAVFLALFFRSLAPKKTAVPEALKKYVASFSTKEYYVALHKERFTFKSNAVIMRSPMEYQRDGRYGIIRKRNSMMGYFLLGVPLCLAGIASVVVPRYLILVAVLGFLLYCVSVPHMMVIDFQERKIFCSRRFRPKNEARKNSVSFSEIDHFSLDAGSVRGNGRLVALLYVKYDGTSMPICKVDGKHLGLLLELAPELAEKAGHLPVTYF